MTVLPIPVQQLPAFGLRMRPWTETDDVAAVHRGLTDPELRRWNGGGEPDDPDLARRWLDRRVRGWAEGTEVSFAVLNEADALLGHVAVRQIDWSMRSGRVGYWVLPQARGRGVASRSLEAVSRWAFESVGLHRIDLGHATQNLASCRVATACGYPVEGLLREALFTSDGTVLDIHLHGRLAKDPWPQRFG